MDAPKSCPASPRYKSFPSAKMVTKDPTAEYGGYWVGLSVDFAVVLCAETRENADASNSPNFSIVAFSLSRN